MLPVTSWIFYFFEKTWKNRRSSFLPMCNNPAKSVSCACRLSNKLIQSLSYPFYSVISLSISWLVFELGKRSLGQPETGRMPSFSGELATQNSELNSTMNPQPIPSLMPYTTNWCIKGRVTSKSSIRSWVKDGRTGELFSFDVADRFGEIRITAFKEQCAKFYDVVEVCIFFLFIYFLNFYFSLCMKYFASWQNLPPAESNSYRNNSL